MKTHNRKTIIIASAATFILAATAATVSWASMGDSSPQPPASTAPTSQQTTAAPSDPAEPDPAVTPIADSDISPVTLNLAGAYDLTIDLPKDWTDLHQGEGLTGGDEADAFFALYTPAAEGDAPKSGLELFVPTPGTLKEASGYLKEIATSTTPLSEEAGEEGVDIDTIDDIVKGDTRTMIYTADGITVVHKVSFGPLLENNFSAQILIDIDSPALTVDQAKKVVNSVNIQPN